MDRAKLLNACAKQCLSLIQCQQQHSRNLKTTSSLFINFTKPLQAEPMKKKKKIDISLISDREDKKLKKLDKQIRKIEAKGKILKPIEEIEGDRAVIKSLNIRKREPVVLHEDELERRALLLKDWSRYKIAQWKKDDKIARMALDMRWKALDELRKESEELYQQAIQLDEKMIPFLRAGPKETPPIKGYIAPDGDYIDTTRTFLK